MSSSVAFGFDRGRVDSFSTASNHGGFESRQDVDNRGDQRAKHACTSATSFAEPARLQGDSIRWACSSTEGAYS